MGGALGEVWEGRLRGGSGWGNLGGTCPQDQALVNNEFPLPPLAHTLTIPSP